jgi:gas vesicle protein
MGNSGTVAASLVGAVIGGVAGYLFFTEHGRTLRRQIEPALDHVARELNSFRSTVQKAAGAASEGWKMLNEVMGDDGQQTRQYAAARQSSPF